MVEVYYVNIHTCIHTIFCTVSKCKCFFVFGRFRWPLKGLSFVRLVWANPLILADSDSAGWTGWEILTVHDEWKMALVMVLVQVERVKMAVVFILKHTGNCCEETG